MVELIQSDVIPQAVHHGKGGFFFFISMGTQETKSDRCHAEYVTCNWRWRIETGKKVNGPIICHNIEG